MYNLDEQTIDKIIMNQNRYISAACRKKWNIVGKFSVNDKKDSLLKEDILRQNSYIIKQINKIKIRNTTLAFKQKIKWLHFRIVNKIKIHVKQKKYIKDYLAIVTIIKNEGEDIKEWIEFHLSAGVDRIYIFDNGSTDNTKQIINKYVDKGQVIYIYYPGDKAQLMAYYDACRLCKKNTTWLAMIDADEYLFPVKHSNLKEALSSYIDYPAVGVNWIVYGTCGHISRPKGNTVDNYIYTFSDKNNDLNCRIKSIVQPKNVLAPISPHCCIYKKGKFAVDENKKEIIGDAMYAAMSADSSQSCTWINSTKILRINHYWTKSQEELRKKCYRGYPDGAKNPVFDEILERLDYPLIEDRTILDYKNKQHID